MALLRPDADVTMGENAQNARRRFFLVDEYGARVDITGYAFRYRVYMRTVNSSDVNVDTQLADVAGAISTVKQGEFYFDFATKDTALPPARYTSELVAWSSGTVTDPPTERYRGFYTVEGRLTTP